MDLSVVRDTHTMISLVHRFVYFVPEAAEEYAGIGVEGRAGYFASRAAPMGAVPDEVVIATFYNFRPSAVRSAMPGVWDAATPQAVQSARFRAASRALERVGAELTAEQITEARSLIDPVVAGLDLAGKPLAAGNASVPLPEDPLLALWQQVTVVREWRGDVHIAVLVANQLGPCDCMVVQVGTGRFPMGVTKATRQWNEQEWADSVSRLAERGWVDAAGAMTEVGIAEREALEIQTDEICAPIWEPIGDEGAARLAELIAPIHQAFEAAGTYAGLA